MSRIVISFVITLVLILSPALGQVINQQTALLRQSSYVESTDNHNQEATKAEVNAGLKSSDEVLAVVEATEAQKAETRTEVLATPEETPVSKPEKSLRALPTAEVSEEPEETEEPSKVDATPKTTKSPRIDATPKAADASTAKPATKATEKPKINPTPKVTEAPKARSTAKATESPKPSSAATARPEPTKSAPATTAPTKAPVVSTPQPTDPPKATEAPKATDPPKAPVESSAPPKESAPVSNDKVFDTSKVSSGNIGVRYNNTSGKRLKLMIQNGSSSEAYNLDGKGSLETFPLKFGNGEYTISVMENTEGKKYRNVLSEKVKVSVADKNSIYLGSIQMINWNSNMSAIKKADQLTSGVSGDEAKLKKIYNFVVSNIRYDSAKLGTLPSTYVPSVNDTYSSKSGICYDFASLTGAMLRSVGIPTKLIMGYADGVNGYHAWNEVYIDGKWVTVDTSYDSQMNEAGASYSMKKSKSSYSTSKSY
ncbi:MAG: hypothetical protein GX783_02590 [Clostridiales bacterium]|nr:hypothetical protein [Clostridiales bacterium]